MNVIDRLNRVRKARFEYERLLNKVEELTTIAERMVPMMSQTPESRGSVKLNDDTWARLIDYKIECEAKLNQYLADCRELEKELECINSLRIRTAMHYRYVDSRPIREITASMGYDERSIYRFLRKGEEIYCNEMLRREEEPDEL